MTAITRVILPIYYCLIFIFFTVIGAYITGTIIDIPILNDIDSTCYVSFEYNNTVVCPNEYMIFQYMMELM